MTISPDQASPKVTFLGLWGNELKTTECCFERSETAQSNDQAKLNLFLSDAYRLRYIALFVVYDRRIANYATVEGNARAIKQFGSGSRFDVCSAYQILFAARGKH